MVILLTFFFLSALGLDRVILREGSNQLVLHGSPRTIPLAENHNYTISCSTNVPEWLHNGVAVPSTGSTGDVYAVMEAGDLVLHFDVFREEFIGTYTCQSSNNQEVSFTLTIFTGVPYIIIV